MPRFCPGGVRARHWQRPRVHGDTVSQPLGRDAGVVVDELEGDVTLVVSDGGSPRSDRRTGTFLTNVDGRRPVHGGQPILQSDPHWRDLGLFYEYFHGDNGAGIGASHQTGWTGTVALLPLLFRGISAEALRTGGRGAIKSAAAGRRTGVAR